MGVTGVAGGSSDDPGDALAIGKQGGNTASCDSTVDQESRRRLMPSGG
jgi:hypothetical protein